LSNILAKRLSNTNNFAIPLNILNHKVRFFFARLFIGSAFEVHATKNVAYQATEDNPTCPYLHILMYLLGLSTFTIIGMGNAL
jgi:hypothetical protein